MARVIALTGLKGCGKNTVGDILVQQYGDRVKCIAFADPIKDQIMHIFGLQNIEEYDILKRSNVEVLPGHFVFGRHIVREIGMLMRSYDVNQFVDYVGQVAAFDPDTIWVVTDLRFDNELAYLKDLGAKIVKIDREFGGSVIDTHITERGFDNSVCDVILENKVTLAEFTEEVVARFDILLKEWNWL